MATKAVHAGAHAHEQVGLVHDALLYRGADELAGAVIDFVAEGAEVGEAALIALPGRHARAVRSALEAEGADATVIDMAKLGRNPARILPFVRHYIATKGGGVRFVGEPIWAGRSRAEIDEAIRHEALINLAFAGTGVPILCPYDAERLGDDVLADAERTHPTITSAGKRRESRRYRGWEDGLAAGSRPLPDLGKPQGELEFERGDLSLVRSVVRRQADRVGLSPERTHGLMLAANEAASNSVLHAKPSGGRLRVWQVGEGLVCEVSDTGRITDPLAGRTRPAADAEIGRGMWLMNQMCDLVEMRDGEEGTTIRLHAGDVHAGAGAAAASTA
jgi:anti-sigma regulatory factor (Ser/Thr protein kinase)